jgi:hypothetical protein
MPCTQQCNQGRACTCRPEAEDADDGEMLTAGEEALVVAVLAVGFFVACAIAGFLLGVLPW